MITLSKQRQDVVSVNLERNKWSKSKCFYKKKKKKKKSDKIVQATLTIRPSSEQLFLIS